MNYFTENSPNLPLKEINTVIQNRIMNNTTYFGIKTLKNPLDFWVYQEIIFEQKPDVIIEIGNRFGDSTLALAHFLDLMNNGKVIGIDITHENIAKIVKEHKRIELIEAPAIEAFEKVQQTINENKNVLIIEDSSHTFEHTLKVLETYSKLIKPGGYFIVEDSICHHGLDIGPKPGPYEAIEEFVGNNHDFLFDRSKESFLITWNPKGFLKRKEK